MTRLPSRARRLVVLVVLAIAVITGSGAFTATTADREAGIAVVDDDRMLLGVDTRASDLSNGRHDDITLLAVENQFPSGTKLTAIRANATEAHPSPPKLLPRSVTTPASLDVNESGRITADVVCGTGSPTDERMTVKVTVIGEGIRFSATRPITITCTGPPGKSASGPANRTTNASDNRSISRQNNTGDE